MTVTVVGGTTLDILLSDLSHLPRSEPWSAEFTRESLVDADYLVTVGGNGGNAAFGLARLGCDVRLVTTVGSDRFGTIAVSWLEDVGCAVTVLQADKTSLNVVADDRRSGRLSFFHPVQFTAEALLDELARTTFRPGDHLILAGYPHPPDAVLAEWAMMAGTNGAQVWLDIGPALAGFRRDRLAPLLPDVGILLGNVDEFAAVDPNVDAAETALALARHVRSGVVVKAGASGAAFCHREGRIDVPALRVESGSSVGAGDLFNAGLVAASIAGITDDAKWLRFGCTVAATMLERRIGVWGAPTFAEVLTKLDNEGNR